MGRVQNFADRVAQTPGILQLRQRRFEAKFVAGQAPGCCRGVYSSYAQAAAAAPRTQPLGYDHAAGAAMYRDRLYQVYPSDYAMMFWLQKLIAGGARKIFDLGGHIGLSFYAYERMLPLPADVSWRVWDLPSIVEGGRAEALKRDPSKRLSFTDNFAEAADADVLFSAGCLQFLDRSLSDMLAGLSQLPPWLLLNLLPLHKVAQYWTVMSIGTAFCPYWIQKDNDFFAALAGQGYALQDRWENLDKDCWVAFDPAHTLDRYHGAALKLGGKT
jgi:putative methyltransferase (TIGR04325 family)